MLKAQESDKMITESFHDGSNFTSYKYFGCKLGSKTIDGKKVNGAYFRVWAPNAVAVKVVGDFNNWNGYDYSMIRDNSGIWIIFIPGITIGNMYKYEIHSKNGSVVNKSDPYAFYTELRPGSASIVYELQEFNWTDENWITYRNNIDYIHSPLNIYELHLGSWARGRIPELDSSLWEEHKSEEPFLNYREIAQLLVNYIKEMNYTHVELMPICEHPFDGSWGYQTTSYFSITSRYGTPEDFRFFIDRLHEAGIGVILDWVPGHFCKDSFGLYKFDGTWLYEDEVDEIRENRLWGTAAFSFAKPEVVSFLISNAVYFLREFHIDGLRVDAVANMLYLDYEKTPSPKLKNIYGGRENIDAINFLRKLNGTLSEMFPNSLLIAEESSAWPLVTKPIYLGGLGFTFKWNMGWMNDTLEYVKVDPIYRKNIHNKLTFSLMYAFSENFILPISHDEVVHGKKSLLDKMFGKYEDKFNAVRSFYIYMMTHPGKKLSFMGNEIGQFIEWRYSEELEWKLRLYPKHEALRTFVSELNYIYKTEKALWELDDSYDGFQWIDADNANQSILTYIRKSIDSKELLLVVCNFTPVSYDDYNIGVPKFADFEEIINSDLERYGGQGLTNPDIIKPKPTGWNGQPFHINIKIPSNGGIILKAKLKEKIRR